MNDKIIKPGMLYNVLPTGATIAITKVVKEKDHFFYISMTNPRKIHVGEYSSNYDKLIPIPKDSFLI